MAAAALGDYNLGDESSLLASITASFEDNRAHPRVPFLNCYLRTLDKHAKKENNSTLTTTLAPFRTDFANVIRELEQCDESEEYVRKACFDCNRSIYFSLCYIFSCLVPLFKVQVTIMKLEYFLSQVILQDNWKCWIATHHSRFNRTTPLFSEKYLKISKATANR